MIGFKSILLNATLAITAALPLATAGMFTSAGSAQAAALKGEFSFNGGLTVNPFANSLVTLKKDSLTFTPDSIIADSNGVKSTPVAIAAQTGSFLGFNSASIRDIISFASDTVQNPFLDLGNLTLPGTILPGESTASLADGKNIFTLKSSDYKITQTGANITIAVDLWGYFTSATGEITKGAGSLSFQRNNTTVAQANTILNTTGGSLANLTFSGSTFTTSVPEPAALLGLGAVGAVMVMSRRRKTVLQ
ncbi:PEP-CTERM sorting domain-containing protein [Nostoc sp. UCD121]|uniref:PEP-CTERM sorting domain-containing protein n=1 Tax=unclassified Nostoc TaxID=2593658 RepID=UPI0016262C8C|nr:MULTISPECIES: PEP-CTERM sorting domain-containing protein [unclassified Nostoc]MBC1219549.1 PEP-CTERM sorting domain-containing protein [Nostoc sp. UCD120]MBC1280603.1 PEP-CTERM sorting domain-containing protein [Nostoc sp. UCD121]MBC1298207.1 PEP-CTERM sorting domain-containing protein [Nostoc sp. UCD122]